MAAGEQTLLRTTFANWPGQLQSFPAPFGQGSHPSRTGALESGSLGYSFFNVTQMDTVYHLTFTFAHTAATLQLAFAPAACRQSPKRPEAWTTLR